MMKYIAWLFLSCGLFAHNFKITTAELDIRENHQFELRIICDLDALALGVPMETDDATLFAQIEAMSEAERQEMLDNLNGFFARRLKIFANNQQITTTLSLPTIPVPTPADQPPSFLGTQATFHGQLPIETRHVQLSSSRALPPVKLTIQHDGRAKGDPMMLPRGGRSEPISITAPPSQSMAQIIKTYLILGFEHILPLGIDHILFVLGLYFGCTRFKPLLLQVSAFTLAHTLTLALATLGIVSLPSQPVEVLIALSIVYVGIENWRKPEIGKARILLVFVFGLLHGLGFAGVLGELGLPKDHFIPALLAFNIGVELGQISIILLAFAILGRLIKREDYRKKVVIPASLLISLVGIYWVIERVIG